MTVTITNFDQLKKLRDEAARTGYGSASWIKFAATMFESFPKLYETAKTMNSRMSAIETALRDLLAQIELHTDCMDGHIDHMALDDQVEAAERLVGSWPEFSPSGQVLNTELEVI